MSGVDQPISGLKPGVKTGASSTGGDRAGGLVSGDWGMGPGLEVRTRGCELGGVNRGTV